MIIPCLCKHFHVLLCPYFHELGQLVRLVLTSRKMVLLVPRPWHRCCYRHSWQVVLRHTFNLIASNVNTLLIQCGPIPHSSTGPKPDSSLRSCSRGYSPWLTSYALHTSLTLWCSVRYQTQCLCLMLWNPFFVIHHRHQMDAHPLETRISSFVSLVVFLELNSEEILCTPLPRTTSVD